MKIKREYRSKEKSEECNNRLGIDEQPVESYDTHYTDTPDQAGQPGVYQEGEGYCGQAKVSDAENVPFLNPYENADYDGVFGMTRSPYLNELLRTAKSFYYEEHSPEVHMQELNERIQFMKGVANALAETLEKIKCVQEDTQIIQEQNAIIEENLTYLDGSLENITQSVTAMNKELLVQGLLHTRAATENLFAAFDILREEELKQESYSKSPLFNELIRIARGVARGAFPPEVLKDMLEMMRANWEKTYKDFSIYKTQQIEKYEVKVAIPVLEDAYEACGNGLQEIALFFEDGNPRHIEEGIALVKQSSEIMVASYELINKAIASANMRTCFHCGAESPVSEKFCVNCQAMFPHYDRETAASDIDIRIDNGITSLSQRMITTHIQKLIDVVESFKAGRGDLNDLNNTIEWLWEKVEMGKKFLGQMKIPQGIGDEEDKQLLKRSEELLACGIENLERALAEMKLYPEDGEFTHLSDGLEFALKGNDYVYEVQQMSQQMWEKYNPKNQ